MKREPRILQFGKFFPPHLGGIETFIYNLTTRVNTQGIQCDVLCSNKSFKYEESTLNGFQVMRASSWGIFFSLSLSPQLIFKLRRIYKKYDIIHAHHPDPLSALALWLLRPSSKVVITWHNDIVRQKQLSFFYQPLERWLVKRADAIVATSPAYIRGSRSLRRYPTKTLAIPLGVDPIKKIECARLDQLKSRFPGKKYFIFSLGRLVEYKGYKFLIKAALQLPEDFQILIGGSGKLYSSLSDLIKTLKVENKVNLLGKVDDEELPLFYNLCDVFCLPSVTKNEAFGLVLLEAMSLGKPLIATNIEGSGVSWVNAHNVTGINVNINDADALATAIIDICKNNELKQKFAEQGLKRYQQNFKTKEMADKYVSLYKSLHENSNNYTG